MARVHRRACAVAIAILACTQERGPRRDTGDPAWGHCGGDSECGYPFDDPSNVDNSVIEIEDNPNNSTLSPCETGAIKSPGADIDSAELNAGTYLSACQITGTTECENDSASAAQAEGTPDATGKEEAGTYTSLNGGLLRCTWSTGAAVTSSDNITVIEIGGTRDTNVEKYRIRVCDSLSGHCQRNSAYASGEVSFSGADLF